ncbi:unnamed protein product [Periconia digitata]|uniref:Uncharacterized protein n=1 Tax=Periconia digitata TaxID=1303443 RepID=A0A9W4U6P1_9PLEO|nr:unnamed protein product [Periconia digitata]
MISSPFTFLGLNYLWSKEVRAVVSAHWMWAVISVRDAHNAFKQGTISDISLALRRQIKHSNLLHIVHHTVESKLFFFCLTALFCFLAAIVGPASALLLLPSTAWLPAGSTHINLNGSSDQLWPQHLEERHAGPQSCDTGDEYFCLQGGWTIMDGFVTPSGSSDRETYVNEGGASRAMWVWRQDDTWATTLHGATASIASRLHQDHERAWQFATGRRRRLRDAVNSGVFVRVSAPVPFARVLCGPIKPVNDTSPTLLFPILHPQESWREEADVGRLEEANVNGSFTSLVNAKWMKLPAKFGTSTAGLAFVTKVQDRVAGCGCSVDARWATGEYLLQGQTTNWQAFLGKNQLPSALKFFSDQKEAFSETTIQKNVGQPISADAEWLARLSTQNNKTAPVIRTALEHLLVSTRLWDMQWVLEDQFTPIKELEAIIALYFVNAISRIGWYPQTNPGKEGVNPSLVDESVVDDKLLHQNIRVGNISHDIATQTATIEWFTYATGWQLNDSALYISVTILALHTLIVVVHIIVLFWTRSSFKAWASISDLLALAYLSSPSVGALENCGPGIKLKETLLQKFKIIPVASSVGGNVQQVQLVSSSASTSNMGSIGVNQEYI